MRQRTQRQQQGFTVSFAAAENALGEDRENQIGDWARIGLASHLDMDTQAMRDAYFDAFPIRNNGFSDRTLNSGAPNTTSPAKPAGPAARIVLICPEDDNANSCGD